MASSDEQHSNLNTLKMATVCTRCILQRFPSRKTAVIRNVIDHRLNLRMDGKLSDLFQEADTLQRRLIERVNASPVKLDQKILQFNE
ncbi:hypothetical protein GJ496_001329 [Pomphorhynchus laevis]|nr:hypothetical protein GJ496_001329 [Pomphorhynchus laevis]